ncbi:hypothetical protein BH23ACT6_BH23ACT6_06000 [soil metagenome]
MTRIRADIAPILAAVALLCACGQAGPSGVDNSSQATSSLSTPSRATTSAPDTAPATAPLPDQDASTVSEPQVAAAIEDLARRQGVPAREISVVQRLDVTWADGAIGCPQPGMQYSQALVPGQLLLLAIDDPAAAQPDTTFAYHAGRGGTFRYCADPQPPAATGTDAGDR